MDVSTRKPTEQDAAPEELKRFVTNCRSEAMAVTRGTSIVAWNGRFARLFGYDEGMPGARRNLADLVTPESMNVVLKRMANRLASRSHRGPLVYDCVRRDGSVFRAEVSVLPWPTARTVGVVVVRNATGEQVCGEQLSESEQIYRALADSIPAGVIITEGYNRRKYVNQRICEITGYSEEELLAGVELVHSDEVEARRERKRVNSELIPGAYPETRFVRKDGSVIWVAVSWTAFTDHCGEPAGLCVVFTDITDQRRARAARQAAENVYQTLAEIIPAGVFVVDGDKRCIYANAQAARITGYSVEELLSNVPLLHPDERPVEQLYDLILRNAVSGSSYETRLVRKDGETIWILATWESMRDEAGLPDGLCVVFNDITHHKVARLALEREEVRYRALAEAASDIIWQMDLNGRFTYVSQSVTQYGYSQEEWIGHSIVDFLPEREVEAFRKRFQEDLREPGFRRYEVETLCKDGSSVWMDVTLDFMIKDGAPVGLLGSSRNITQRKKAEDARRDSEQRFEALVQSIPGAVYRCAIDVPWTMTFLSDTIQDICGYPASDFIDNKVRPYASIIHPDDRQLVSNAVLELASLGRPYSIEYRVIHADESVRIVFEKGRSVLGRDGQVRYLDGVILDVTDSRRTREALEVSEERYRNIVENASELIMLTRPDGVIEYVNPRCRDITGYEQDELIGHQIDLTVPEEKDLSVQRFRSALVGEPGKDVEGRIVTKSGEIRWVTHSWSPVFLNGDLQMVVSVINDITEAKRVVDAERTAHENLARAYELQRQFLHGVTHEVRTPLTMVQGYVGGLLDGSFGSITEEQAGLLRKVLKSSDGLLQIVQDVMEAARLRSGVVALDPIACKPCEVVQETVALVEPEAERKGLYLQIDCQGAHGMRIYDRPKLAMVLNNILGNAIKFTKTGGVEVMSECSRNGLTVVIVDSGMGIRKADMDLMFDEFAQFDDLHRQKPQGFGLGLAVAAGLVELMGATLTVSSAWNVGTAFTLFIPTIICLEVDDSR